MTYEINPSGHLNKRLQRIVMEIKTPKEKAEDLIFSFMKLPFIKTYLEAREAAIILANESFRYALNNSQCDVDMKYWHNIARILESESENN